jgi:hypothetical protein
VHLKSWLAVMVHSLEQDELRDVARRLCAAASVAAAGGARQLAAELVDDAERVLDLALERPAGTCVG